MNDSEPTSLDRAAWFSLRALVVGLAVVAALLAASRLRVVLIPIAVTLLLAAPLRPVAERLGRVVPRSAAAILSVVGLLVLVGGALGLAGRAVAQDADELGAALSEAVDDIEDWLVDGPIGMERARIEELRSDVGERIPELLSGSAAADGAVVVGEVFAGAVLALVLTVFAVRDADRLVEAVARRSPPARARRIEAGATAMWRALRRYLLGAAALGAIEAAIIGTTVAIVGSPLAVPVAVFTFVAAFVPLVGAIVAGVVAVLASFVGGGIGAAVVVAVVALVVQQFDNDLLGPLIYGRATQLHPAVVLLAITTGTALAGLAGTLLAVPLVTVFVAVSRATTGDGIEGADDADGAGRGDDGAEVDPAAVRP